MKTARQSQIMTSISFLFETSIRALNSLKSILIGIALLGTSPFAQAANENGGMLTYTQLALQASWDWITPIKSTSSPAAISIQWTNSLGEAGAPCSFSVVLWMPSMGHGSAPTKIQPALNSEGQSLPGKFEVHNMRFMMSGHWQVLVKAKSCEGTEEMQMIEIHLGGPHDHHPSLVHQ